MTLRPGERATAPFALDFAEARRVCLPPFQLLNPPFNSVKAAVHTQYGPPEVVQVREVAKPVPNAREVLIRVHASTVNRTDCGFRSAEYFVSRFFSGLFKPKQQTLGCEFAGVVEAVGQGVTDLKVGDRVFGFNDERFGGHAEYLTRVEHEVVPMPAGVPFAEAAALTEGAHYALGNIRAAKVRPGHRVLVYGATGAIGSAAVQLLKHAGATVTAVCATKHVALVKSIGADRVVDYRREDFTKTGETYHFVFDAVGKSSFSACKPLLTPGGVYISTEPGKRGDNVFRALFGPLQGSRRVLFPIPKTRRDDFVYLKNLAEAGHFKPLIDRTYPLEQIVEAYRYVETGQKIGNVVITVAG